MMKRSNKVLLGGVITPIVLVIGFILYMSFNSSDDPNYQLGQSFTWHSNSFHSF